MNKTFRLLGVFLFFLSSNLLADDSFEKKQIEDIQISIENLTDSTSNTGALLKSLATQKGTLFSQDTFDADLKKLAETYDRIEPNVDLKKDDKIYIHIKLWQRPTIAGIIWHENDKFSKKKLQNELGIKTSSIYNKAQFNTALNKVKEFYIKKGYFESQITYKETPVKEKNEIKIDIYVKEGKSGKIQKINFKGFTKKEESDLLKEIVTKKYNVFLSWFSGTGIYREDAIEQDKMNVINYLQNKGYADAKVDINISEDKYTKKILIEIIAHRGILYRFGKITFDGNCLLSNDEIINRFIVHPEEPFSPEKIRQTAQAIKDAYGEKGYIEANVYFDTHLMENEPIYNINFVVDEGECYKIGLIKVYGNKSTKTNVILRESLLVPGQTFDSRKLKATQTRLENIGYFKSVNVYAVQSTDNSLGPNYRDVHIEVEETSTGHLSFAAGFSSSENVTGTLDLTENNFDHEGLYKMFKYGPCALRGGGEYAQLKGSLGKRQKNVSAKWMTPYFRDSLWRFGFDFNTTFSRLQSKNYKIKTLGGSTFAAYPLSTYWSVGMKYRLRNTDNVVKKKAFDEKDLDEQQKILAERLNKNEGIISGLGSFLSYDSTDNSYKPHQGMKSALEAEYVGLGGKYDFFKFGYLNSYYYPLWAKGTFKYRYDFQFIERRGKLTTKKVPMSERFFLGGETTVRGYKPYIIGPIMSGTQKDPLGGVSSMLLSIEYNQEIIKPLIDFFVFADAGSIAFKSFDIHKPRSSVGFGLRLEIMNRVPITVGWGYPVNPKKEEDRQSVFFYMGGQF